MEHYIVALRGIKHQAFHSTNSHFHFHLHLVFSMTFISHAPSNHAVPKCMLRLFHAECVVLVLALRMLREMVNPLRLPFLLQLSRVSIV